MTFSHLLTVLKARWLSALIVFAVIVGLVVGVSLWLPKQYTANAVVLLDAHSRDPIEGVVQPGLETSTYMATQVGVIQSDRVLSKAIRDLRLDQSEELKEEWQRATQGRGDMVAWLSSVLAMQMDVRPMRDANLINVAFTSLNPTFAADLTNAVVKSYVAITLDLRVQPAREYTAFFDSRAAQLREALERAQAKLSALEREKGMVASDERLDTETAKYGELTSQLVALQGVASESGSRQRAAGVTGNVMQEVLASPLLSNLTTDYAHQEATLNEISARLGDQNPQVVELKASMSQLRDRIDTETRRVKNSVAVNNNVNQSRVAQLTAALEAQRAKLLTLKGQRDEAAVLQRDVQSAQQAYDAVTTRLNQTGLESQTTQTNVAVMKEATVPLRPSGPRVMLNTAAAVVLGALLGLATSLVRERLDPRLRLDDAIMQRLGQPLMGQLPVWVRAKQPGTARLRLTKLHSRAVASPALGR